MLRHSVLSASNTCGDGEEATAAIINPSNPHLIPHPKRSEAPVVLLRAWGLAIQGSRRSGNSVLCVWDWEAVLWRCLTLCAEAEERWRQQQRLHLQPQQQQPPHPPEKEAMTASLTTTTTNPSTALRLLDVDFDIHGDTCIDARILQHLTSGNGISGSNSRPCKPFIITHASESSLSSSSSSSSSSSRLSFSDLMRSLVTLRIQRNDKDESEDLRSAMTAFPQLRELSFESCGLSSLKGLQSACPLLRKINVSGCRRLTSLDGLQGHERLQEVVASTAPLTSIQALAGCPILTKVHLFFNRRLTSLDGLQGHLWLEEVNASSTPITSVSELMTCPALTKVGLWHCQHLSSLDGLQSHCKLQEVDAASTAITTICELLDCPALTNVSVRSCRQLASLDGLEGHRWLRQVDASSTAITSIQPLTEGCPALSILRVMDLPNVQRRMT